LLAAATGGADEVADVRQFVERSFPGKSWDAGPERIDSPELRETYPGLRFYFVASREPLPPGAYVHSVQETYRREKERVRRTKVTAVIGIDTKGRMFVRDNLNRGLRPVRTAKAARTSCIAVLSLAQAEVSPPGLFDSPAVTITPEGKGWKCSLTVRDRLRGEARFDAKGRCTRAEKWYVGPLPPSQPPPRQPGFPLDQPGTRE
jgi:hypothetical protein